MFRKTWQIFCVLLLIGIFLTPTTAAAQSSEWREQVTTHFRVVYAAGDELEVDRYVRFVDTVFEDIAIAFNHRIDSPLTLRLYPTSEDYYQANPAARDVPGVIAHADFRRRELVVIVERTRDQPDQEVINTIRHELTHIVVAELSDNRLNTGFQEGIAQYMELPAETLAIKIQILARMQDQGLLLPWSALDDRERIYGDPQQSYPQTLAIVAFLVERGGFAQFREFLTISARSSGYRSALERTYGVAPATLEAEWRTWLPDYINGGYQRNALETYDLGYARTLLSQGNYAVAEEELRQAIAWLQTNAETQPPEVITEAEALLERSRTGVRAEQLIRAARQALEQADYNQADALISEAQAAYTALGDTRQDPVLRDYAERVARGRAADAHLQQAGELAGSLRYPQARATLDEAASEFAALGDDERLNQALQLRRTIDWHQRALGLGLMIAGFVGAALSMLGRIFQRPAEVW
jgi:tetratricopeptide (TPR) repeat protein